jgi:hypothetical protein
VWQFVHAVVANGTSQSGAPVAWQPSPLFNVFVQTLFPSIV